MKIKKESIRAYALKNAVEHEGDARLNSVINGLFNEGLTREKIKDFVKEIQDEINLVNKLSVEEQISEFEKVKDLIGYREVREGLPEFEKTKGVRMRFSPSASGPLHIGHALTASTSFLYTEKYGGKLFVRIEDTNPDNCFKESYKLIKDDSKWLFNGKAEVLIQSERMELYYKYIEKLIKKDKAYVCSCPSEDFKILVSKGRACGCRGFGVKENLARWNEMLKTGEPGKWVVRFKSDLKHPNIAMREFPLARVNLSSHPLQKKKYRVWPLMNLAVSVDDIEMKMTHIIRAKDHRDNAERQKMIFAVFDKQYPESYFLGRIHFKDMDLSTTMMRGGIDSGKYTGWDDEKLPTLISLRAKGYKPEQFWKMAEEIGLNEVDKKMTEKEFFQLLDRFR